PVRPCRLNVGLSALGSTVDGAQDNHTNATAPIELLQHLFQRIAGHPTHRHVLGHREPATAVERECQLNLTDRLPALNNPEFCATPPDLAMSLTLQQRQP